MELWSPVNPLCELVSTTNINALVQAGTLTGWNCDEHNQASPLEFCFGYWTGVTCNNIGVNASILPNNETINTLSLPGVGLTGSLPNLLSLLDFVVTVDLSNNQLTGSIPVDLGSPGYITKLDLNGNKLTGKIPSQFEKLVSLNYLDLSSNSLSHVIPQQIGGITGLAYLDVSYNSLVYSIPASLGLASQLTHLDVSSNILEGNVPDQLCNLNLNYLSIDDNPVLYCYSSCLTSIVNFDPGAVPSCTGISNDDVEEALIFNGGVESVLVASSGSGAYLYAATPYFIKDDGTYYIEISNDYGKTWSECVNSKYGPFESIGAASSDNVYCTTSSGVFESPNNGGNCFDLVKTGDWGNIATCSSGKYVAVLNRVIGGNNIYVSEDYGLVYSSVVTDINPTQGNMEIVDFITVGPDCMHQLAVKQNFDNITAKYYIYTTENAWVSWSLVQSFPSGINCNYFTIGPTGYVYASGCYQVTASSVKNTQSIYYSTNYGFNWTNMHAPASNWLHISTDTNTGAYVIVTSSTGIYRSTTYGTGLVKSDGSTDWDYIDSNDDGSQAIVSKVGPNSGVYIGKWDISRRRLRSDASVNQKGSIELSLKVKSNQRNKKFM